MSSQIESTNTNSKARLKASGVFFSPYNGEYEHVPEHVGHPEGDGVDAGHDLDLKWNSPVFTIKNLVFFLTFKELRKKDS